MEKTAELADNVDFAEIQAAAAEAVVNERTRNMVLPLVPDVRTAIQPVFTSARRHRITARLPEDTKTQQWTGVRGQVAKPWVVAGYSVVEISIEWEYDRGNWRRSSLSPHTSPPPYPYPTRTVYAEDGDSGDYDDAMVRLHTEQL